MAKRKFGALADFRRLADGEAMETTSVESLQEAPVELARPAAVEAVATAIRGKGRPPGKRSNPEWKLYSHFLKKKTQRLAAAHLAALDDGRDLSDVLQELLERWLKE